MKGSQKTPATSRQKAVGHTQNPVDRDRGAEVALELGPDLLQHLTGMSCVGEEETGKAQDGTALFARTRHCAIHNEALLVLAGVTESVSPLP